MVGPQSVVRWWVLEWGSVLESVLESVLALVSARVLEWGWVLALEWVPGQVPGSE